MKFPLSIDISRAIQWFASSLVISQKWAVLRWRLIGKQRPCECDYRTSWFFLHKIDFVNFILLIWNKPEVLSVLKWTQDFSVQIFPAKKAKEIAFKE